MITPLVSRTGAWIAATLVSIVLTAGGFSSPALAHSDGFQSSPVAGSTVSTVTKLQFTFAEAVQQNFNPEVVLTGDRGVNFPLGKPTFDVTGSTMTLPIEGGSLPNGSYGAVYRVVSVDGHIATGVLNFTVAGSTATAVPGPSGSVVSTISPTATGSAAADPDVNTFVVGVTIAGALGAIALAFALVLVAIRRRR